MDIVPRLQCGGGKKEDPENEQVAPSHFTPGCGKGGTPITRCKLYGANRSPIRSSRMPELGECECVENSGNFS